MLGVDLGKGRHAGTWKCLVCPGVAETETFLFRKIVLMVELLPTLG